MAAIFLNWASVVPLVRRIRIVRQFPLNMSGTLDYLIARLAFK